MSNVLYRKIDLLGFSYINGLFSVFSYFGFSG